MRILADVDLTARQQREVAYHRDHAASLDLKDRTLDFAVVTARTRRWWNAYWDAWTFIRGMDLKGLRVLVIGCGAGQDAFYFASLGAQVSAFDLSADMLQIGIGLAEASRLPVDFSLMPSERMTYPDDTFDVIFARDILHHVDIPATMKGVVRVSKGDALFIADEIYSHSLTEWLRRSRLVEKKLYPKMQRFIYNGAKPYITRDERKMSEADIATVKAHLSAITYRKYFNFLVTRILPEKHVLISKIDRLLLILAGPLGRILAGRIVFAGRVGKS
jgi:ubiquinone/menaquinone biosynthesis C-methylase UbiE